MSKRFLFLSVVIFALVVVSVSTGLSAPKQLWTYGTTSKSSGFFAIEVFIAQMINKHVPEVSCNPIETGAVLDNWTRLGKGELEIGFGASAGDWQAANGEGQFKGNPIKNGRVLWVDGFTTYNWVVHASSGIKTIHDLNGKRVDVGIPGSTSEEQAMWVLKLLGVKPKDILKGSTGDSVTSMQDRRTDAWQKGCANPDSAILSLLATTPISILNFSDKDLDTLQADRPYVGKATVPANVYKGVPAFKTYGGYLGVIIRADIPQELQYKVIKAVHVHWDDFLATFPQYKSSPDFLKLTAENAVAPLSAGTVQYLQEKGYSVPVKLIPPEYKKK